MTSGVCFYYYYFQTGRNSLPISNLNGRKVDADSLLFTYTVLMISGRTNRQCNIWT